jgi:RNA polymerase primary sigma factor
MSSIETRPLLDRYVKDVCQYDLLSPAEEKNLVRRIDRLRQRRRRALYTAPVLLPTLIRAKHDICRADMEIGLLFEKGWQNSTAMSPSTRFDTLLSTLTALSWRLNDLRASIRARQTSANQRHCLCQRLVCLLRQWIDICEQAHFSERVHGSVSQALHRAQQACPDDHRLSAAARVAIHIGRQLRQAENTLLQANLRLVIHMAKRYRRQGEPMLDLIQEGNIGLIKAIEKFDPSRGIRFVTYAHWWVRHALNRAVANQQRTIRLPTHIGERRHKLQAMQERLGERNGQLPSVAELSVALEWSESDIEDLQHRVQPILRLYQPMTEDGAMLANALEDDHMPRPEDVVLQGELQSYLSYCLSTLSPRQARIVRLRYGLGSHRTHSLQEIGDMMGLSRERIRQIEKVALQKLREPNNLRWLEDFVTQ